jgi:excisionase family DNA binding protein
MTRKRSTDRKRGRNGTKFRRTNDRDRTGNVPNLYTVLEAAMSLRTSRSTIYAMLKRKELRSVKLGGRRLILEGALIEYIARKDKESSNPGE